MGALVPYAMEQMAPDLSSSSESVSMFRKETSQAVLTSSVSPYSVNLFLHHSSITRQPSYPSVIPLLACTICSIRGEVKPIKRPRLTVELFTPRYGLCAGQ